LLWWQDTVKAVGCSDAIYGGDGAYSIKPSMHIATVDAHGGNDTMVAFGHYGYLLWW
jgi:hypothetical protein